MQLHPGRVAWLLAGFVAGSLVAVTGVAVAAPSAVKRIEGLNARAISAFEASEAERAEALLLDAVVLAKQNQLGTHPATARTYLNLGLVNLDGLKDQEKGERYFTLALRIDPKIQLKSGAASETVAAAFDRARLQADKARARDEQTQAAEQAGEQAGEGAGPVGDAPAEQARKTKQEQEQEWAARQLAEARDEVKEKDQKARAEQEKFRQELAQSAQRERQRNQEAQQERTQLLGEKERLLKEKQDLDRLLSREKQDLQKQLADTREREKKEREAKDKLQAEKVQLQAEKALLQAERDKLLKEKQELDRRLGETGEREKKERLAREKLEQDRQAALAREAAEKEQQKQKQKEEQELRAKLAEGPPMPASIPQKLFCSTPDSHPPGVDVFVHCIPQAQVKADELTLYYRPSGHARYSSIGMERANSGKTGWFVAMIPSAVIKGSMLQYYVQAGNGRNRVAASNGKSNLPNVVMVNRWTPPSETPTTVTTASTSGARPATTGGKLTRARARARAAVRDRARPR